MCFEAAVPAKISFSMLGLKSNQSYFSGFDFTSSKSSTLEFVAGVSVAWVASSVEPHAVSKQHNPITAADKNSRPVI
jgi:hypothetical protein